MRSLGADEGQDQQGLKGVGAAVAFCCCGCCCRCVATVTPTIKLQKPIDGRRGIQHANQLVPGGFERVHAPQLRGRLVERGVKARQRGD